MVLLNVYPLPLLVLLTVLPVPVLLLPVVFPLSCLLAYRTHIVLLLLTTRYVGVALDVRETKDS